MVLLSGALAMALAPGSASASVPAPLRLSTVQAARATAAGPALGAGTVSAKVAALSEGVLKTMGLTKVKSGAAVLLMVAVLGTGAGLRTHGAGADKPADRPRGATPVDKGKPETEPTISAKVKTVDVAKGSITLTVSVDPARKETADKTFHLASDVQVLLTDARTKNERGTEGKLADLAPGTHAVFHLSRDQKTVRVITVGPAVLQASVKAVEAGKKTITVTSKQKGSLEEKTYRLTKDSRVLLNDGLTKGQGDAEGKWTDLAEGTPVELRVSALDGKTVLDVRVHGKSLHGQVKGVDTGNRILTLTVKEDAQVVDKTLSLAKDAKVDGGSLTDLAAGTPVSVTLSVFDPQTVVRLRILQDGNP